MDGYTISITDGDTGPKMITRITPYADGGFAVLCPYHKEEKGFLMKVPVRYDMREFYVPLSACTKFSADDKVKLSFHPGGFVQFSSATNKKIISGFDPQTGRPKGLGLVGPPLTSNLQGPSFGINIWGLKDFKDLKKTSGELVNFAEKDYYFRNCLPGTHNGFMIEFFLMPTECWNGTRKIGDEYHLNMVYPEFDAPRSAVDLRILPLPNQPMLFGVVVSRMNMDWSGESGFAMSSMSDGRHNLQAVYPSPFAGHNSPSIMHDRNTGEQGGEPERD